MTPNQWHVRFKSSWRQIQSEPPALTQASLCQNLPHGPISLPPRSYLLWINNLILGMIQKLSFTGCVHAISSAAGFRILQYVLWNSRRTEVPCKKKPSKKQKVNFWMDNPLLFFVNNPPKFLHFLLECPSNFESIKVSMLLGVGMGDIGSNQ